MHYLVFQLQFFGKLSVEFPSYKGFCAEDLVALFQVFPLSSMLSCLAFVLDKAYGTFTNTFNFEDDPGCKYSSKLIHTT